MTTNGFALVTRNGRLFRQEPGKSDGPSIFSTRDNADATNASMLRGTGRVVEVVGSRFAGATRSIDGYWIKE